MSINLKYKYQFFIDYFSKNLPSPETELIHINPFQLLVSTILSAQCTDKRVNIVTGPLFKKFLDPLSMSKASFDDLFPYIKSISYPNAKTKNLISMSGQLIKNFGGQVPDNVEKLETLSGVGRKTANVVAAFAFNQPKMPVDTHVFRVSARIGLTKNTKTPLECEKQLVKNIPEKFIPDAHHWLILHGRYVCKARKPMCEKCGVRDICDYYYKIV